MVTCCAGRVYILLICILVLLVIVGIRILLRIAIPVYVGSIIYGPISVMRLRCVYIYDGIKQQEADLHVW